MVTRKSTLVVTLAVLLTGVHARTAFAQTGPMIEDVEPTSGPPGTLVHVTGRRFAPNAKLSIGGQDMPIESRLPNRISVRIAAITPSGAVAVGGSNGSVRGVEFRVTPAPPPPVIDSVEPASGRPGARVALRGKNFSPRFAANVVTLGGRPAVVLSATPQQLEITVPEGATSGPFVVNVQPGGEAQSKPFTVTAATAISGYRPERGVPGAELTIRGQGFAHEAAHNRVFLGNVSLPIKRASETELVVTLPAKIASGELLVDVDGGGRAKAPTRLIVQLSPKILRFSPQRGQPGTVVTVRGTNFGNDPKVVEATLIGGGAISAEAKLLVRSVEPTRLELEIPAAAVTGRISIRVFGVGPAWSDQPFTVVPPPKPKPGAAAAIPAKPAPAAPAKPAAPKPTAAK
jgi:hypothetical protein